MPITIERIYCPFDKQRESADSLVFPLALAGDFRARLIYCYCLPKNSKDSVLSVRREISGLVEKKLNALDADSVARTVKWKTIVFKTEDTAARIVCQAARSKADLIVVRRAGSILSADPRLGPVTENLCRTAHSSVLVLQPEKIQDRKIDGKISFRKILSAYDFSDYSELALQTAAVFCEKYDAELHLLHVLPEPRRRQNRSVWPGDTAGTLYHQTNALLRTAIAGHTASFAEVPAVRWGKSYREILRYAAEHKIDLIAMGAHGKDFGISSLFGSNVDRVLRQAPCPVLVARPFKPHCDEKNA